MNERIEELIVAYLHQGSTPELEHELFEACSETPEVAQLLRRHLILSLKLRRLRDDTVVPTELHHSVLRRINEIEATELADPVASPIPFPLRVAEGAHRLVFGWRHLIGTAVAGAALATAFFLIMPVKPDPAGTAQIMTVTDTLVQSRVDTLVQLRTVYRFATADARALPTDHAAQIRPAYAEADGSADPAQTGLQEDADIVVVPARSAEERQTALPAAESTEGATISYIEQYTAMVTSLEKVSLTSKDRVR